MCSSLGRAYLGLSLSPGLGHLFPLLGWGSLQLIMSSNMFSAPFSLFSPSGIHKMQMLVCLMWFQRCLSLFPFIFILFFYILFCGSDFHHSVFQITYLFFCLLLIHSSVLFFSVCLFLKVF